MQAQCHTHNRNLTTVTWGCSADAPRPPPPSTRGRFSEPNPTQPNPKRGAACRSRPQSAEEQSVTTGLKKIKKTTEHRRCFLPKYVLLLSQQQFACDGAWGPSDIGIRQPAQRVGASSAPPLADGASQGALWD